MERFEFDPEKSHTNKIKHGIDFLEAQALWTDSDGIEVPALTRDEPSVWAYCLLWRKAVDSVLYPSCRQDTIVFGAPCSVKGGGNLCPKKHLMFP